MPPASSSKWDGLPRLHGRHPEEHVGRRATLRDNGYATGMFGKWHNTPEPDISPAGPFDRWPTGLGFDYFYGFNQGETHQYYPVIYRNTTWVPQPKTPEQGYHFTADMTDELISWTRMCALPTATSLGSCTSSTSGVHAPHHGARNTAKSIGENSTTAGTSNGQLTHAGIGDGNHPAGYKAHIPTGSHSVMG